MISEIAGKSERFSSPEQSEGRGVAEPTTSEREEDDTISEISILSILPNMARKMGSSNGTLYACEVCGFRYRDKSTAEKCQAWCTEHKSCNLEIIKEAVQSETTS